MILIKQLLLLILFSLWIKKKCLTPLTDIFAFYKQKVIFFIFLYFLTEEKT